MINPLKLKQFIGEMHQAIDAINFHEVVIDDSQLTNFLRDITTENNQMLFGIVPEYPLDGDQDKVKWKNQLMFMVLEKPCSSNITHQEFLEILDNTLLSAREFVNILLAEKSGDNGDFCEITNQIKEDSVRIYPIWNKSECHGWGINMDLLTSV